MNTHRFPIERFRGRRTALAALALMLAGAAHAASSVSDPDMTSLAQARGCALCHAMDMPRAVGVQVPPVGPTWLEIASRYRSRPGAEDTLTQTILMGSEGSVGATHWAGRASGVEMPANRVEVSEADARRLAAWILSLKR